MKIKEEKKDKTIQTQLLTVRLTPYSKAVNQKQTKTFVANW